MSALQEVRDLSSRAGRTRAFRCSSNFFRILCSRSEDFREGMAAFLDKRAPVYSGR